MLEIGGGGQLSRSGKWHEYYLKNKDKWKLTGDRKKKKSEYMKAYRIEKAEKISIQRKKYNLIHNQHNIEYRKQYLKEKGDLLRLKKREFYKINKIVINKKSKAWRKENPGLAKGRDKKTYLANISKIREKSILQKYYGTSTVTKKSKILLATIHVANRLIKNCSRINPISKTEALRIIPLIQKGETHYAYQ